MGRHKLREDKKCQNCGGFVRKRFCPKCGQENVETRQPFHYLFTHFIEDLVHYDGSFWETFKNLFFKPGALTKEYLEGKRKKFVAPVKLYIFVSFFVFFVGGLISKLTTTDTDENLFQEEKEVNYGVIKVNSKHITSDSLENENIKTLKLNLKEYDSIQASLPEYERDSGVERMFNRKRAEREDKYTGEEFSKKFLEVFTSNFQKFLFFYMPVFAFLLWLFQNKKKWYYFDHGIFTLHYFSFILLSFFISISIIDPISSLLSHWIITVLAGLCKFVIFLWMLIYFFKALRKVYNYSRISTIFRGLFLLFLNMTFLTFGIFIYIFVIFYLI